VSNGERGSETVLLINASIEAGKTMSVQQIEAVFNHGKSPAVDVAAVAELTLSRQLGVRVADEKELLAADIVFVATPPVALDDVAAALKGYAGIIVFGDGSRRRQLRAEARRRYKRGRATCAPRPERARRHCVHVHFLGIDPRSGERRKPTVFHCADDEAARSTVIALAKEIGLEGVDIGHLDSSPNIENLGLLVGQLAYGSGFGNRVTLPLM
jgi:predicted dinucleotide-binding enzyme